MPLYDSDDGSAEFTRFITPATLSSSVNDYNPTGLSDCNIIRQGCTAASTLTGLLAPALDGKLIILYNISTNIVFTLTLAHDSASSTAANRFFSPANVATVIPANGSVILQYDATASRWRITSKSL